MKLTAEELGTITVSLIFRADSFDEKADLAELGMLPALSGKSKEYCKEHADLLRKKRDYLRALSSKVAKGWVSKRT